MPKALELTGETFGRLSVQNRNPVSNPRGAARWDCVCQCGNTTTVLGQKLKEGRVNSCGCLKTDVARELAQSLNASHGQSGSPEYSSWQNMKDRCLNPSNSASQNYGERGIGVCDRWKDSFENFLTDMGPRPEGTTLDRKEVNGNYEPNNCRWATGEEQANNKRTNVLYDQNGKTYTRTQLCALTGVDVSTFKYRVEHGKSIEESLK